MSRGKNVTLWILQVLVAAGFLIAGVMKLISHPMMVKDFDEIGWGQWFRYVTGTIEVTCAILVLRARTAPIGAALLFCTMIGAVIAHLTKLSDAGPAIIAPIVLGLMCAVIFSGRRENR